MHFIFRWMISALFAGRLVALQRRHFVAGQLRAWSDWVGLLGPRRRHALRLLVAAIGASGWRTARRGD